MMALKSDGPEHKIALCSRLVKLVKRLAELAACPSVCIGCFLTHVSL